MHSILNFFIISSLCVEQYSSAGCILSLPVQVKEVYDIQCFKDDNLQDEIPFVNVDNTKSPTIITVQQDLDAVKVIYGLENKLFEADLNVKGKTYFLAMPLHMNK